MKLKNISDNSKMAGRHNIIGMFNVVDNQCDMPERRQLVPKPARIMVLCVLIILTFSIFNSCKKDGYLSKENYKNVVYLLSTYSNNVFPVIYPLNDGQESTAYFSIGCGGSLPNPEEFTVELEKDTVLLNRYNRTTYDIDKSKYAKLLPEGRFKIENYKVTFPANNQDQYVKVAVKVMPDGLSPDSLYFIPIAIKSISKYEVNPEKFNLMLWVLIENKYAQKINTTYYQMKGLEYDDAGQVKGTISSTKLTRPISKKTIRFYAGGMTQTASATVAEIVSNSINITIDDNNKVTISPYGTIQVEQISSGGNANTYEEIRESTASTKLSKYIYLHYRYRTVKTPATPTAPAVYNNWITVKETLRRLE